MHTRRLASAVIALTAVACAAAGTAQRVDGGSALSAEEQTAKLCDDVVPPFCDALFACCTDPQTLNGFGGSVGACNSTFAVSCKRDIADAVLPAARAGATVLNETRLSACVASLRNMKHGGASCTRGPRFVVELDCVAAFQGQVAPGGACDASTLHDMAFVPCEAGSCTGGTCSAFLARGAACDPAQNDHAAAGCNFANGDSCFGTGSVGVCRARGAPGAACDRKSSAFSCDSMSCGESETCIPPSSDRLCAGG